MSSSHQTFVFDREEAAKAFFGDLPMTKVGLVLRIATAVDGDHWSKETGYSVAVDVTQPLSELEAIRAHELVDSTAQEYGSFSHTPKMTARQELEKHLGLRLKDYAVDWNLVSDLVKHYDPSTLLMMFPGSVALTEILILAGYSIHTMIDFCFKASEQGFVKVKKEGKTYLEICLTSKKHSASLEAILEHAHFTDAEMMAIIATAKHNKAALKRLIHHITDNTMRYNILLTATCNYETFLFVVAHGIDLEEHHQELLKEIVKHDVNFHVFAHLLGMTKHSGFLSELVNLVVTKPKLLKMVLKHCQNKNIHLTTSHKETDACVTPWILLGGYDMASNPATFEGDLGVIPYSELMMLDKKGDDIAVDIASDLPAYQMTMVFKDGISIDSLKKNSLELLGVEGLLFEGNSLSLNFGAAISPAEVANKMKSYGMVSYSVHA